MATPKQLMRWREEYRQLFQVITDGREQMRDWVEDPVFIMPDGEEVGECLASIKNAIRRYWELIDELPNVHEFTESELQKRDGKVEKFIRTATELEPLIKNVERRLEELIFLSDSRLQ